MAYATDNTTTQCLTRRDVLGFLTGKSRNSWHYLTADTPATVETANYFDAATNLHKGDMIAAVMSANATTPILKSYVVTAAIAEGNSHNVIALQTTTAG